MAGSSSGKELKVQELAQMQAMMLHSQASSSKKSSEPYGSIDKQMEQGQQGSSDQRNESKPPLMQTTMGHSAAANMTRPAQLSHVQQGVQNMGNNQIAVAAQLQAWAFERNIDLSQPANANLVAQLMPFMQSRMMAQQRTNDGNSQSSPVPVQRQQVTSPRASESSPHANSSSEVSGQSGSTRARQTVTPGPFGSASNSGLVACSSNLPAQFPVHGRENQVTSVQSVVVANGMPSIQASRPPVNLNQGLEHSLHMKNAASGQDSLQMQHLRQLNRSSPQPAGASSDGGSGTLPPQDQQSYQISKQQIGFTKQQLHVLKAQILAFRRLKV